MACSIVQMEIEDEFLNFNLSVIQVHRKKDHIKITLLTKFEVLSLDFNHVEAGDFVWIWGMSSQN